LNSPPCVTRAALPGTPKPTRSKAIEAQNPADGVACEHRHQNQDGLHVIVLVDLCRATPGRLPMAAEVWRRRRHVTAGVCDRAPRRHRRGALSVALRDIHCIGHQTGSGSIEARNSADEVTCGRRHRNHHGLRLVVLLDLRRDHPEDQLRSDASQRSRLRIARSVSASSPPRCALRPPSRTAPAPRPGGFGGDRSSEPGR
jgi:hypothetical protein